MQEFKESIIYSDYGNKIVIPKFSVDISRNMELGRKYVGN
jgi:hypothetical protein